MPVKIRLYGTSFCHLCEQAEAILDQAGMTATHVDITEDDSLLEKYGTRIPVLLREDNGAELGWPFDLPAVIIFLS